MTSPGVQILCLTQAWPTSGEVTVEVSIDGGLNYFGAEAGSPTYRFTDPPVFDPSTVNIVPNEVGIDHLNNLTVTGQPFPSQSLLAPGFPLCQFHFPTTAFIQLTHGEVLDSTTVRCPQPPGPPDTPVQLQLSFNGHEFFEVLTSTPLHFIERPAVMSTEPAFGDPHTAHELTLAGSRLDQVTTVGYEGLEEKDIRHEIQLTATPTADQALVPGALYPNVSTVGKQWLFGEAAVPVEVVRVHPAGYSSDQVVYQYTDRPILTQAVPEIVNADLRAPILVLGEGFKRTPQLACKFGNVWAASAVFINETAVQCHPPALSLAAGSTLLLTVTLNGLDAVETASRAPLQLSVAGLPLPVAVYPSAVFIGEVDVTIQVKATGVWNTKWLSCSTNGLSLAGTYSESSLGEQFVTCVLPSTQYLRAASGTSSVDSASIIVELSNDGQLFSSVGLEVLLTNADQVVAAVPANGPPEGGTVIDVALRDLAAVNALTPEVKCIFPGDVIVDATYLSRTRIQCISPAFNAGAAEITYMATWAWAPVNVTLEERSLGVFQFAYALHVAVV